MENCIIEGNELETPEKIKFESIQIEQNELIYDLSIEVKDNIMIFSINDKSKLPYTNYSKKMNFSELINLNKVFDRLHSFRDFYNYLKSLSDKKLINIKKYNDKISIIFYVEVLLEKYKIEIELFPNKKELVLDIKEIYQELCNIKGTLDILKKDNENLKEDNKKLNGEIDILKNENNELRNKIEQQNKDINEFKYDIKKSMKLFVKNANYNNSEVMTENEKMIIFPEIEKKMNKKIKEIKKLYQATTDGGDPLDFHLNCDNIPNTLILVKSEGLRRFGGFTPIAWKSDEHGIFITDFEMKTFVFSLDNKKIYNLKSTHSNAVYHGKNTGPCFGSETGDISIIGNPIKEKKLCNYKFSYDYKGINDTLSECVFPDYIKAIEYEVFEVIFNPSVQVTSKKPLTHKKRK